MNILSHADAKEQALTRYFTGKPCARGHFAERMVSSRNCVACKQMDDSAYRSKNSDAIFSTIKIWRSKNPQKFASILRRYRDTHRDEIRAREREYIKNNPDKIAAKQAKRRASRLMRTPAWLSDAHSTQIENVYAEARALSKLIGEWYEVDHIIPLRGKLVSGLHVPWNLQILPSKENAIKSNRVMYG